MISNRSRPDKRAADVRKRQSCIIEPDAVHQRARGLARLPPDGPVHRAFRGRVGVASVGPGGVEPPSDGL
jgi:hypothetical protein